MTWTGERRGRTSGSSASVTARRTGQASGATPTVERISRTTASS